MRCSRCDRTLKTPAASVITKAGSAAYGKRCAEVLGLIDPPRKTAIRRRRRDDKQIPLDLNQ